jgi:YedE family putative selenium metabolism protein
MNQRKVVLIAGAVVGALSVVLAAAGNPANMGICVACFIRDIAGGLGLHRAEVVQYLRPEMPGFIIGSMLAALAAGEFRARGGSSPVLRFALGFFVMIGALVFLGCPLRMVLRLAGGDLNAVPGILGFTAGTWVGVLFLRRGFTLGRSARIGVGNAIALPVLSVSLLILAGAAPAFVFFSSGGPGSAHAPVLWSLAAGLVVGALAQRSRLCLAGGVRDLILIRDAHLFRGSAAIFIVALILNVISGRFKLGFEGQPVAHTDGLWNFLGMMAVGLGAILLGGCPLRQCILAGEGDSDGVMAFLGMLVGAAFAHNWGLASSPAGPSARGKIAVVVALVVMAAIGYAGIEASRRPNQQPTAREA